VGDIDNVNDAIVLSDHNLVPELDYHPVGHFDSVNDSRLTGVSPQNVPALRWDNREFTSSPSGDILTGSRLPSFHHKMNGQAMGETGSNIATIEGYSDRLNSM